jgi:putative hemolysin
MEINLPADNGVETLGGFVFERLGELPRLGDTVEADHAVLEVVEIEGMRIKKVRVTRRPVEEPQVENPAE